MSLLIKYIFKWNALSDACSKCRSLNGREYEYDRIYKDVVWDGQWGNIWDLNTGRSLAHPNCRCQLALRVEQASTTEFEEILLLVKELNAELRQLLTNEVFTK